MSLSLSVCLSVCLSLSLSVSLSLSLSSSSFLLILLSQGLSNRLGSVTLLLLAYPWEGDPRFVQEMCPHRDSDRHKTEKGRSTKVEDRACMQSPSTHVRFDVAVDVFIS